MAVADRLRPTLLRLGSELRREKIAGVSPQQVGLLVAIKYTPGVTVGELSTGERVSTAAMSKRSRGSSATASSRARRASGIAAASGSRSPTRASARCAASARAARRGSRAGWTRSIPTTSPQSPPPPARSRSCSATRRDDDEARPPHGPEPPLPELPALLRRPGRLADGLLDAADRARLVHPRLTHNDPFAAGLMAFAQFTPYMLFGLFAGVLTDRLDARRPVLATQTASSSRPRRSRGSRSAASRSLGCST